MKTPFEILGVADTASDEAIKKAYLQKVREYPPERAPERFQEIRAAFEAVRDHRHRLRYQLFHRELPDVRALAQALLQERRPVRPDAALIWRVLAASARGQR